MGFSCIPMILSGFLALAVSPDGRSIAYTWSCRDLEDDAVGAEDSAPMDP